MKMAHSCGLQRSNLGLFSTDLRDASIAWFLGCRRCFLFLDSFDNIHTVDFGCQSAWPTSQRDNPWVRIHILIFVYACTNSAIFIFRVQLFGWCPLMFLKSLISYWGADMQGGVLRVLVQLTLRNLVFIVSAIFVLFIHYTDIFTAYFRFAILH